MCQIVLMSVQGKYEFILRTSLKPYAGLSPKIMYLYQQGNLQDLLGFIPSILEDVTLKNK